MNFNFSANDLDFGNFSGETIEAAMESFASHAGYASWAEMTQQAIEASGSGNIEIREVLANGRLGPDIAPDQSA